MTRIHIDQQIINLVRPQYKSVNQNTFLIPQPQRVLWILKKRKKRLNGKDSYEHPNNVGVDGTQFNVSLSMSRVHLDKQVIN